MMSRSRQEATKSSDELPCNLNSVPIDLGYVMVSRELAKRDFTLGRIGACLNLEESEIATIEKDGEFKPHSDKVHTTLITWRDKHAPNNPTWESLIKALETLGDKDLLSSIRSYIVRNSPTSLENNVSELQEQVRHLQPLGMRPSEQESCSRTPREESNYHPMLEALVTGHPLIMTPRSETSSFEEEINPVVEVNMKALETSFAGLTVDAHKELKGVPHEDVAVFISTLSTGLKEKIPLADQRSADIISGTSLMQVFVISSRTKVWDFINFDILEATVNKFGEDNLGLKAQVQRYRENVDTFKEKTKLADFLRIWASRNALTSLPDCKPVIAKLDEKMPNYTLAKVTHLEKYLADQSQLKRYILRLSNGIEGCVALMWLVPSSAANMMKTAIKNGKPNLALMNVQGLWIDGELVFKATPYRTLYNKELPPQLYNSVQIWGELASIFLKWKKPFKQVMQKDKDGIMKWFGGGKLNLTDNCLDRHVAVDPNRIAIIWEKDEPGCHVNVSYRKLQEMTCQIANVLKHNGVKKGDVVLIYMPAMPHAVASMLACARIGAVHCVMFSAFGAEEVRRKIVDTKATVVITANERLVGGKRFPLKVNVDQALRGSTPATVKMVLVASRTKAKVPMMDGRDIALEKAMAEQPTECSSEPMDSEDGLFIMYTSGTTNKPKAILHTQAGYLLYAAATHKLVFDYQPGDIFACVADLGWITGHSYVVYGPLCNGATSVLFESTATYPNCGRYWEMVERLKVNQFYTIPSVLKHLMKAGDGHVNNYNLSSLKTLASIGEPLNPAVQEWYYNVVGHKKCTVIDTWWQTEIGGVAITHEYSPNSKSDEPTVQVKPFFDVQPALVDEKTFEELHDSNQGLLVLKKPLPGMGRAVDGDPKKFVGTYYPKKTEFYNTYDMAQHDAYGDFAVTGRLDDAIRIKGVWLKIPTIESAVEKSDTRIEGATLVGYQQKSRDERTPEHTRTCLYIKIKEGVEQADKSSVIRNAKKAYAENVPAGATSTAADPRCIFLEHHPKTHSGKVIRRPLIERASKISHHTEEDELMVIDMRTYCEKHHSRFGVPIMCN